MSVAPTASAPMTGRAEALGEGRRVASDISAVGWICGCVYAPARDMRRPDAQHLQIGVGPDLLPLLERLRLPADRDAVNAACPGRVTHHKGQGPVLLGAAKLLAAPKKAPADIDRIKRGVIGEAHRHDVRLACGVNRCQP